MIYNDSLKNSYGTFAEVSSISSIVKYRPSPTPTDYNKGYITRNFAKKINENIILEVEPSNVRSISKALYKVVSVNWKITGPKNNVMSGNMLNKAGVMDQNMFEIDRVKKEENVDLSIVLHNPLEYWRGS